MEADGCGTGRGAASPCEGGSVSVDCGDGERVDVDQERRQRARKEYKCNACKETIERGHLYVRHTLIYAREVDVTIRCLRCDAIYQHLVEIHREHNRLTDDPEWPDLALNCGHEFKERWGNEPPLELARLAFMTPAEVQAEALAKMTAVASV
jgi:hypothetical protein